MYDAPLARAHDEGFGFVAEAAAREVMRRYPLYVVDVGCGGGRLLELLGEVGIKGHGIDASNAMVRRAQARGVAAAKGNWTDFDVPAGALVTATGEVLAYEVPNHGRELAGLFRRVARAGGSLLFDVPAPGRGDSPTHVQEGDGWKVTANAREVDGYLERTIVVETAKGQHEEVHRLRLFDPDSTLHMLESAGFHVEELGGYDDLALQDGWDVYLATPAP